MRHMCALTGTLIAVLLAVSGQAAAISVLNVQSMSNQTPGPTYTLTLDDYTVGAGSNLVLVVAIGAEDAQGDPVVESVTYGADALSLVPGAAVTKSGTNDNRVEIWYRVNPTPDTRDITVTFADGLGTLGADACAFGAMVLDDVDTSDPVNAVATTPGPNVGDDTVSTDITTTVAGCALIDVISQLSVDTNTPGGDQTEIWEEVVDLPSNNNGGISGSKRLVGLPDTYTNTWTADDGNASRMAHAVVAFAPAPDETVIPEPLTMLAVLTGAGAIGGYVRRRRRA